MVGVNTTWSVVVVFNSFNNFFSNGQIHRSTLCIISIFAGNHFNDLCHIFFFLHPLVHDRLHNIPVLLI